jgi:hypothetical protein
MPFCAERAIARSWRGPEHAIHHAKGCFMQKRAANQAERALPVPLQGAKRWPIPADSGFHLAQDGQSSRQMCEQARLNRR